MTFFISDLQGISQEKQSKFINIPRHTIWMVDTVECKVGVFAKREFEVRFFFKNGRLD